jgi:hypothetical protein
VSAVEVVALEGEEARPCPDSSLEGHFEAAGEEAVPGQAGMEYACWFDRESSAEDYLYSQRSEPVVSGSLR